jgi:hypothetical protein
MATDAIDAQLVQQTGFSLTRLPDRWIWVFTAALLVAIALAGFIPSSIQKVQAVQAQQRLPFPWFLHIHAVAMGSWLLLLLAQTSLIGTGRRQLHTSLGIASLVLAPLVFVMMVVLAGLGLARSWTAPAAVPLAAISAGFAFVLIVQGRCIVLFATFYIWAFRTRLTKPDTHKRMMVLATWSLIDAAIVRIPGSNDLAAALQLKAAGLTGYDIVHIFMLVTLLPALMYDLIRHRRIHYAWVAGLVILLPFAVAAHYLEVAVPSWGSNFMVTAPSWWQQIIAGITGRN